MSVLMMALVRFKLRLGAFEARHRIGRFPNSGVCYWPSIRNQDTLTAQVGLQM